MTSVFVVAHHQRSEAASLSLTATDWLSAHGHDVWMPREDADEFLARVSAGTDDDDFFKAHDAVRKRCAAHDAKRKCDW